MFNLDFTYLTLNLFLLLTFVVAGINISLKGKYFPYSFFCIIIYTFVLGFRLERGHDYVHYQDIYQNGYDEGSQVLFSWLNSILKEFGVNKYFFFAIYNLIEISCGLIFLKEYKKYAVYMFPLFMMATLMLNEYQIRQALGYSFVFLCLKSISCINYYNIKSFAKSNTKSLMKTSLYFLCAYSIHTVCGYILILMILIFLCFRTNIKPLVSIIALLFGTFFFSKWFDFSWLNPFLSIVVRNDERMATYVGNSDMWFSSDAMNPDDYSRKPAILFFEICGTVSLYYLGAKAIKLYNTPSAIAYYNFFVIGTIIVNSFRTLELLNRIGTNFSLFYFFPLSLTLYYRKRLIKTVIDKLAYAFLVWWFYDYIKYLFFRGDMTKFIWDI